MSLYNLLFCVNNAAPVLLATLGLTAGDVPRFRDCYIDGDNIVIHTRTGGGNREYYEAANEGLQSNPFYVRDEDDDFDYTYANFYYRFPDEYAEELKAMAANAESVKPSEKWEALLESLNKPGSSA